VQDEARQSFPDPVQGLAEELPQPGIPGADAICLRRGEGNVMLKRGPG
jgi:hypothetical protein